VIPRTDDPDTAGFFAAAARGELAVRICDRCSTVLHTPRAYCSACGSWDSSWQPVRPTGTLYSWTVTRHQANPEFAVPYTVVLVQLDDAPDVRLLGHLPGTPDLTAGQPMVARFDEIAPGVGLPQWETAEPAEHIAQR
jgi:uncharacterized OB-fold protein